MKYFLALALVLGSGAAQAQSTGDAALDARLNGLWNACKTAPADNWVHVCFQKSTDAAHLYTQWKIGHDHPKAVKPTGK